MLTNMPHCYIHINNKEEEFYSFEYDKMIPLSPIHRGYRLAIVDDTLKSIINDNAGIYDFLKLIYEISNCLTKPNDHKNYQSFSCMTRQFQTYIKCYDGRILTSTDHVLNVIISVSTEDISNIKNVVNVVKSYNLDRLQMGRNAKELCHTWCFDCNLPEMVFDSFFEANFVFRYNFLSEAKSKHIISKVMKCKTVKDLLDLYYRHAAIQMLK